MLGGIWGKHDRNTINSGEWCGSKFLSEVTILKRIIMRAK